MQENIISSIYNAYLDNEFEDIQPLRPNDLQSGYEKLNDFEKKHNISTAEQNEFYTDVLNEFTAISELKGFTNGFKLAARLLMEICNKPQIAEKKIFTKINEKATDKMNTNDEDILCKVERLAATIVCTRSYFDEFDEKGEHYSVVYSMLRQAEDMADEIYHIM